MDLRGQRKEKKRGEGPREGSLHLHTNATHQVMNLTQIAHCCVQTSDRHLIDVYLTSDRKRGLDVAYRRRVCICVLSGGGIEHTHLHSIWPVLDPIQLSIKGTRERPSPSRFRCSARARASMNRTFRERIPKTVWGENHLRLRRIPGIVRGEKTDKERNNET